MKQKLINILKTIFSDVRQAAIPAIIILIFGGSAGVILLSQRALDFTIQLATIPTPLWANTIGVILVCFFIYLNTRKILKKYSELNQLDCPSNKTNKEELEFVFHKNLLWLQNDNAPFCPFCYEINGKPIHLLLRHASNNYDEWDYYECHNCEYKADFSEPPNAVPF